MSDESTETAPLVVAWIEYLCGCVAAIADVQREPVAALVLRLVRILGPFSSLDESADDSAAIVAFRDRLYAAAETRNERECETLCDEVLHHLESERARAGDRLRTLIQDASPAELRPEAPAGVVFAVDGLHHSLRQAYGADYDIAIVAGDRVLAARDRSALTEIRPRPPRRERDYDDALADPWTSVVQAWLDRAAPDAERLITTSRILDEALESVGALKDQPSRIRVADIMRALGFDLSLAESCEWVLVWRR